MSFLLIHFLYTCTVKNDLSLSVETLSTLLAEAYNTMLVLLQVMIWFFSFCCNIYSALTQNCFDSGCFGPQCKFTLLTLFQPRVVLTPLMWESHSIGPHKLYIYIYIFKEMSNFHREKHKREKRLNRYAWSGWEKNRRRRRRWELYIDIIHYNQMNAPSLPMLSWTVMCLVSLNDFLSCFCLVPSL